MLRHGKPAGIPAAAILVVVGAALLARRTVHLSSHGTRYLAGGEYATEPGQRQKISLPDDTTFVLAPSSQGRLVFNATPLSDVARQLGRWYGVNIVIGSPALEHEPITATYTNLPLANVLELLAHAIGAQVEQHGRTIVLRSRSNAATKSQDDR
jgi:ferric-dicitrate binding protein FerR (iron transport regulator)